jgi:hypothetical protein
MTHASVRSLLLSVVIAVAWMAMAGPASATVISYYDCVNKPEWVWCDGRANSSFDGLHSWDYNKASDPAQAGVIVCQGLYKPSTDTWVDGHSCAQNNAMFPYPLQSCACLEANILQQGPGPRSVVGFAHAY